MRGGALHSSRLSKLRRICAEWGTALLLAVALVMYFLDWHVVHKTNALEGFSLTGPSAPAPPLHDTGVRWTCTGFSHYRGSFVIPALLVALLLLALLTRKKPGLLVFAIQGAAAVATVTYAISSQLLEHMFDRVETLLPETLFFLALLGCVLAALLRAAQRCCVLLRRKPAA